MTQQRATQIDKRISTLQYINTLLLGLLTLAVGVGVNQMAERNKSYTAIIIEQAKKNEQLENLELRCSDINYRLLKIEAILPKETYLAEDKNQ